MSFQAIHKLFLYAGLEKEDFEQLLPRIRDENRILLKVFSQLAGVMFFLLYIVSMITMGFATVNSTTYLVSGFIMLIILFCVQYVVPKKPSLVMLLVYIFEIVLYVFGIRISMLHADKPAVSAVAFLLVSPLLFYDRPTRLSALIAAVVGAFCVIAVHTKQPDIASIDVWNMITFGVVAVATTIFIMSIKIRALAQSSQIEYMSQTDLLTGLKNREMCRSNLVCVYGDVNGLHEKNNREGHHMGDVMLKEVAAAMQKVFGLDNTYRVGGDEFVAFKTDGESEKVSSELERISAELGEKGYHISFGVGEQNKAQGDLDMHALVTEAEKNMFAAKQEFYRQPEHNRRSR